MLDGRNGRQALTYRHYFLNEHKCLPILDELAYNAGTQHGAQAVHDFMVDAEVDIVAGTGILTVALDDGGLEVEAALPVGVADEIKVVARQQEGTEQQCPRGAARVQLLAGKHYHIEMALVDRRLTLRIDGLDAFAPLDFPAAGQRDPVMRPLRLGADGVLAHWRHVRLYRDVHYTQAGQNAVHGTPLSLGADETFVLGDNSPNSEDSRFWSNRVPCRLPTWWVEQCSSTCPAGRLTGRPRAASGIFSFPTGNVCAGSSDDKPSGLNHD